MRRNCGCASPVAVRRADKSPRGQSAKCAAYGRAAVSACAEKHRKRHVKWPPREMKGLNRKSAGYPHRNYNAWRCQRRKGHETRTWCGVVGSRLAKRVVWGIQKQDRKLFNCSTVDLPWLSVRLCSSIGLLWWPAHLLAPSAGSKRGPVGPGGLDNYQITYIP